MLGSLLSSLLVNRSSGWLFNGLIQRGQGDFLAVSGSMLSGQLVDCSSVVAKFSCLLDDAVVLGSLGD